MTMANTDLAYGDEVLIPWGFEDDARGTVQEVYGPPARRHVVVLLTSELSGAIVDEPSTVSMPIDTVKKVAPAA
jgi:hypothetical protein